MCFHQVDAGNDMEAISCLLDFSMRDRRDSPAITTVGTFTTPSGSRTPDTVTFRSSTPKTPAAAPRPERPPRMISRRVFPLDTPRPIALRRPPSAALGAPPQQEEEDSEDIELPDIPDSPRITHSQ